MNGPCLGALFGTSVKAKKRRTTGSTQSKAKNLQICRNKSHFEAPGSSVCSQCPILYKMREVKPDSGGRELTLIRQIRSRATQWSARRLRVGIGDDCAILRVR